MVLISVYSRETLPLILMLLQIKTVCSVRVGVLYLVCETSTRTHIITNTVQTKRKAICNENTRKLQRGPRWVRPQSLTLSALSFLTHCILNRLSHIIYWKSSISILGTSGWDVHIPREKRLSCEQLSCEQLSWNRLNYLQIVETLIRRRVLQWVK